MVLRNWHYYFKISLLLLVVVLIFIITHLIYILSRGEVIGLKDIGWMGCEVIFANEGLAKLIAFVLPIMLFTILILFLIKKAKFLNISKAATRALILIFILLWFCNLIFYIFISESPTLEMLMRTGGC